MESSPFDWHKSSYSGNQGGDCVEIAETPRAVLMRDTQNRKAATLAFSGDAWSAFLADVKTDRV